MHSKLKKTLQWSVIVFASLLIGVPLLLAAINAVDQDLRPEAIAFADLSDDNVPDKDNGYYAWVGLAAPIAENPYALGMKAVSEVNKQLAVTPMGQIDTATLLGPQRLQFKGNMTGLCGRDSKGCLVRYRSKTADIRNALRDNRILLDRYRSLYTYSHFREVTLPRFAAPIFTEPAVLANLLRAQQGLVALQGNPKMALQNLRADSAYWRRILEQSRSLINRMLAVAMIHGNAQLVSEIVANYPLHHSILDSAADAARPLLTSETDLGKVFRYEFGYGMHLFTNLPAYSTQPCLSESWTECQFNKLTNSLFVKPNATINLHHEMYSAAIELNRLPAPEFITALRARQVSEQAQSDWPWSWHFAYNPGGKIATFMSNTIYASYTARIHNLDGFLRLVSLQIAVKRASIRDIAMQKFLADSVPDLHNPYTGEAMLWDADARAIYFNGYNEKADDDLLSKRIEVRL